MYEYAGCLILFLIGLYTVMVKRNIYKIAIGILTMEFAVDFFLVFLGNRKWGTALIILAVTLIALTLLIRAQAVFQSLDAGKMKELNG
ncbi:MAG: NADH-quinone oxidoreductase subunit K [Candidatus Margulisiibacteriota bacterium]|jgi:multisubunit Na+/H+ antiporter MnhC subunit